MCELCIKVKENEDYQMEMKDAFKRDFRRLMETKRRLPQCKSVFTNRPDWAFLRFDFPVFEPLAAFSRPEAYYQPMKVDGEPLRNDWQHDWTRWVGFLPNGNILVLTKAVEREAFNPDVEWFLYFYLVEFKKNEIEIVHEPPRFTLKADEVRKRGRNLVAGKSDEHTFSFTFTHQATEKTFMKANAIRRSAFYREIMRKGGKPGTMLKPGMADFEKYVVTTLYWAPHPYLMKRHKEFGYETRYAFQSKVPKLLEKHLG